MASLLDTIMGNLGGDALKQIGRQLGSDEKTAETATGAAVATLLGALANNAADSSGADALSSALARDHDGSILDDVGGFLRRPEQGHGEGILRHVLGAKRRGVEAGIGKSTGLDADSVGRLLVMLAPIVLGALGRTRRQGGMGASALAGLLGQERGELERREPRMMGGLSSFLDTDGDGDVDLGDVARRGVGLLGKFFEKR